jgi:glucan phosphoethanolaminetransferase (alkaline phosphatase superfamily)
MPSNSNLPQTPATFFRTITLIHLALAIGQVLFGIVVLSLNKRIIINIRDTHDPMVYLVPLMAITCFILSGFLFKKVLSSGIKPGSTLKQKLVIYQTALIIRLALLEGPSLFGIVAFFLTGSLFFLIISATLVAYFIYIRPTRNTIEEILELSYAEKEILNRRDEYLQ